MKNEEEKWDIEFLLPEGIQSEPNTITLSIAGKEKIKMNETGFYIDNVLIENDKEIYNHFKMWLDFVNKEMKEKNGSKSTK